MADNLFEAFEIPQPDAWKNLAEKELSAPLSDLKKWKPAENLVFNPYVTYEDQQKEESGRIQQSQRKETGWFNMPLAYYSEPEKFIKKIKDLIKSGADAVILDPGIAADNPNAFAQLINDLHSIDIPIFFKTKKHDNNLITEIYNFGNIRPGGMTYDPVAEWMTSGKDFKRYLQNISVLAKTKSVVSNFYPLQVQSHVFHEAGADPVQELALTLSTLVLDLDLLTDAGIPAQEAFSLIYFSISSGPQYLTEIAKLRAFRALYARIAQCYAIHDEAKPFLHSATSSFYNSQNEPHTNMIRTTSQAMSAVIGGADALTVKPFDHSFKTPDEFSERIAKNISLIISHESFLNKVSDPAAGSYLIEEMTIKLTDAAWNLFLSIEEEGGIEPYFLSGALRKTLDKSWNDKIQALMKDNIMVGVNKYLQKTENPVEIGPAFIPDPPYLPARNLPRDYAVSISLSKTENL